MIVLNLSVYRGKKELRIIKKNRHCQKGNIVTFKKGMHRYIHKENTKIKELYITHLSSYLPPLFS